MLNDDDEELRELAASTASWILSYSTVSPSKAVTLAPRYASDILSKFIVESYAQSSLLCTRIIQYITGQAPKVSGSVDKPRLKAVPDQLCEHRKESTILFEEEKQNLFIDEVREVDVWAPMLLQMAESSFDSGLVREITTWVLAGLSYICKFAVEESGNDGLLGWASKPETFTLGVRVISVTGVLVSQHFAASRYLGEEQTQLKQLLESLSESGRVISLHDDWLSRAQQALQCD